MKTMSINENNDIYLTPSGNISIKTDIEALGDILVNKTQTNRGELQFDEEKGIDFLNTIFNSPAEIEFFESELINQIEDTDNVQNVYNFESETKNGIYSYKADIITDFGNITLNG